MLRLSHAALGAALALAAAACASRSDSSAASDSAATPVVATPLTGDSAAPVAATTAGASDSAASVKTASGPAAAPSDTTTAKSARSSAPTSTRPAAATARSTAPVPAGSSTAPRTGTGSTTAGAAAVARSTSPVATAATTETKPAAPKGTSADAPAAAAAHDQSVKVNQFMSYNPAARTVSLQVTAALTSQRGGFNFNGGSDGAQTITVPQGWTVRMHVRNVDAIPHSAILILDQKPLPNAPDSPAISRAYTAHVNDGLPAQTGEDDVEFRASKAGNFLIYCGVPGHGPSGMYIRFVVAADATAPSYSM